MLNKRYWYKLGLWDEPLLFKSILSQYTVAEAAYVLSFPKLIGDYQACGGWEFIVRKDFKKIEALASKQLKKKNLKFFDYFLKEHEKAINKFLAFVERITRIDIQKLSKDEVSTLWYKFYLHLRELMYYLVITFPIDRAINYYLLDALKRKNISSDTLFDLVKIRRKNIAILETENLLKLLELIKRQPFLLARLRTKKEKDFIKLVQKHYPSLYKKLLNHQQKYIWVKTHSFWGKPLTINDIVKRLKWLESKRTPLEKEPPRRINLKIFSKTTKQVISVAKEFAYFRLHRAEMMDKGEFLIRPLLKKIASWIGMSYNELVYLTIDEIQKGLEKKLRLSKREIYQRRRLYGIRRRNNVTQVFVGRKAKQLLKKITAVREKVEIITGMIASRGKVRGQVRKVLNMADLKRIKKGDIFVASETTPEFITGLRKAAAIITDEGGITSHAAIFSRELAIPCIVGTKIATRVLEEGNLVEVDANKGIIKKLT